MLRLLKYKCFADLKRAARDPAAVQHRILKSILRQNRNTAFGCAHSFYAIKTVEDYRRAVPIRNAPDYQSDLQRVYAGERNVLTREDPFFFAMTAGSTGDYKYLPITSSLKKSLDRSLFAYLYFLEQAFPEARRTPVQFLVGSADGGESPGGVPQGFVSGFNYKNLPSFLRRQFVVPYWVFTLADAGDRYYAIGRYLAEAPGLTGIAAISPLNIANVAQALLGNLDRLEQDLASGTVTLLETVLPEAASCPRPNRSLSQALSEMRRAGAADRTILRALFPCLNVYATWLGGNMGAANLELTDLMGPRPVFELPYSASEGIFAIPHLANETGGIAAVTGHFLEYVPEEDIDSACPRALGVEDLEEGQEYYQVVTTAGGLYRYNMEDLVRVKGRWRGLPVVEFVSKKARQVSIANERLTEEDVVKAVGDAIAASGYRPSQFLLVPTRRKAYQLLVESTETAPQAFANAFQQALCARAKGYDFEREDRLLECAEVATVAPGALEEFAAKQRAAGAMPNAQIKPLHLCNDFDASDRFIPCAVRRAAG